MFRNFLVIGYLSALLFLGVRGYLLEDTRFAWGMFRNQINYTVSYSWETESGERIQYKSGDELKRGEPRMVSSRRSHRTRYGIGAVRDWTYSYLKYLWEEHRPEDAVSIEAVIEYRINKGDELISETYRYPPRRESW
ncbi:MAG: hypothetical protein KC917_20605 [Candidatus Omnitrophica bacterium]|nr:hypothetical protein [Candidatus Omnitrophota bacterium]MCB9782661.1 hypothetical protein [Candidatus Omnitrophota bacterium]